MSAKQAATYHGADIVTRLRLYGPESDYDGVMSEAADEIEKLRRQVNRAATAPKIKDRYGFVGSTPMADQFDRGYNTALLDIREDIENAANV